ncbi:MAG: hypothetical protein ACYDDU_14525, partial [Dermatophilaceae bacterium]
APHPHGNGQYRTLRSIPNQSGAATGVVFADTQTFPNTVTKIYTTGNYWRVSDDYDSDYITNVSAWCATCHTRYLATGSMTTTTTGQTTTTTYNAPGSTASGDAVYAYRHRSDGQMLGMPSCIQCHVAHGSNASMGTVSNGVTNPDGTPTATVGDSRLLRIDNRGTCQMCHNK